MSFKKKATMAVATTTIGALVMGAGTFALFTDQQTVTNHTFAAGTLKLGAGQTQSINAPSVGLIPGQTINGTFNVLNDGSLPLRYTVTANTSGRLFTSGDYNGDLIPDTNHAVVTFTTNQTENLSVKNDYKTVGYSVTLPKNAGNDFQGATGDLSFTVSASQQDSTAANGWMLPQIAPTVTKESLSADQSTGRVELSFKINGPTNGSIDLSQTSLGDVKIIYGTLGTTGAFSPYVKDGKPLLVKSKAWSGYLNVGSVKYSQGIGPDSSASFTSSLPMNQVISTVVDARYASMAYADTAAWRSAVATGIVAVNVVVTDNNGNTTEQVIKVE